MVAGEAHGYVLLGVAAIALVLAGIAVARQRWRLGRLVAVAGIIGIIVSLAIDMPKGLDEGSTAVAYAGANATLDRGFYAQLAASGVLALCGLLLGAHMKHAAALPNKAKRAVSEPKARPARAKLAEGGT